MNVQSFKVLAAVGAALLFGFLMSDYCGIDNKIEEKGETVDVV